jgi:hypothetical protein
VIQWLGSLIYITTKREHLTDIHIMHDQVFAHRLRSFWAARAAWSPNKQNVPVSQVERASTKRERTSRAFQTTVPCAGTRLAFRTLKEHAGHDAQLMEQKWNKNWNKATVGDMKTGLFHGTGSVSFLRAPWTRDAYN